MVEVTAKKRRIFHIAKELNISHEEIIELLKANGVDVHSHMSPVDEDSYQLILDEFEKERETVARYRKEKVRKEIHDRRIERIQEIRKFEILMPDEQRKLEEEEKKKKIQEELAAKQKEIEEKAAVKIEKTPEEVPKLKIVEEAPAKPKKAEVPKKPKLKLRKVSISEIESQIETTRRKPVKKESEEAEAAAKPEKSSIDTTIRKTLAKIDTKTKKKKYRKVKVDEEWETDEEVKVIKARDFMSVQELAKLLDVTATDVITKCLELGVTATMNQRLDMDTITLIADEFGCRVEQVEEAGEDIFLIEDTEEDIEKATPRAPVVTIMGHVDHGKTSLLDYIRNSNVVAGEAGGITQQIGAYQVVLEDNRQVTFLDTPGHEAFTAMRARGAQITDVVILIVAADDGVKPQTKEAIDHAKAAKVPIVVAINKIDKNNADPERIKRELSEYGILVEDWGGDYQCVELSAKTGQGVDELLELLALETDILELKANADTFAKGTVIESRLDKGHGAIATVLVQKGTLKVGDPFICGNAFGKVRALLNERNVRVRSSGPSDPVQVLGLDTPPQAGDRFAVLSDERQARKIAEERERVQREIDRQKISSKSLDKFSEEIRQGLVKSLPLIIKADIDGSIEALVDALSDIPSDEVQVSIIRTGVGMISESDVLLASASDAIIIGFNIKTSSNAKLLAKNEGVEIRHYDVIYDVTNDIKLALEGLLEPEIIEESLGKAEVKKVFRISKVGFVAGCIVLEGTISKNDIARVRRDGEIVYEGTITSLKHFQDEVKKVTEGKECGISIEGVKHYLEGDLIETYITQKVKRTLD